MDQTIDFHRALFRGNEGEWSSRKYRLNTAGLNSPAFFFLMDFDGVTEQYPESLKNFRGEILFRGISQDRGKQTISGLRPIIGH